TDDADQIHDVRACLRSPSAPRRELFARRPRKNEGTRGGAMDGAGFEERGVDVRPRLSDDAGMRANRPGPGIDRCWGCHRVAAMRQCAAWPASQAGAAPRPTTWRPLDDNAGCLGII